MRPQCNMTYENCHTYIREKLLTNYQANRTKMGVRIMRRNIAVPSMEWLTNWKANRTMIKKEYSHTEHECHRSTGSPSALVRRVLRGGVTILEGGQHQQITLFWTEL